MKRLQWNLINMIFTWTEKRIYCPKIVLAKHAPKSLKNAYLVGNLLLFCNLEIGCHFALDFFIFNVHEQVLLKIKRTAVWLLSSAFETKAWRASNASNALPMQQKRTVTLSLLFIPWHIPPFAFLGRRLMKTLAHMHWTYPVASIAKSALANVTSSRKQALHLHSFLRQKLSCKTNRVVP